MDIITSVTAILGSIKTATDIAKIIKDSDLSLEKAETKLKLANLIDSLADAKLKIINVQEVLLEAEARIRELEQQMNVRQRLEWREPFYWRTTETGTDGPFCQKCYDVESSLVRLQGDGNGYYECRACKSSYVTQHHRERSAESIQNFKNRDRRIIR